jgi:hypothetical protein
MTLRNLFESNLQHVLKHGLPGKPEDTLSDNEIHHIKHTLENHDNTSDFFDNFEKTKHGLKYRFDGYSGGIIRKKDGKIHDAYDPETDKNGKPNWKHATVHDSAKHLTDHITKRAMDPDHPFNDTKHPDHKKEISKVKFYGKED